MLSHSDLLTCTVFLHLEESFHLVNPLFFLDCSENVTELDDASSMLKGMKGYRLTPGDLEFIKKMKEEKLIKKYQVIMLFTLICRCD